ncbi:MAG: hypothetical protein AB7S26_32365 [Sandaracinaceae bacterium]
MAGHSISSPPHRPVALPRFLTPPIAPAGCHTGCRACGIDPRRDL